MKLALIISTYDQPDALSKVLQGVKRQTRLPDEILIADDGSGEETRTLIYRWMMESKVPVRHLWHSHDGFRKIILLNKAVRVATSDYLVFLDGDCVPHSRFIADHAQFAEKHYWVQGRRCFVKEQFVPEFEAGRTTVWQWMLAGRISGWQKGVRLPLPLVFRNKKQRGIIGCNMAFWRSDIVAVNGFDEKFLGRGIAPDSELGTRMYNLGRQRKFVYGRAIVYHLNHPVMPRENMEAKRAHLQELLRLGTIRCEHGLDQNL